MAEIQSRNLSSPGSKRVLLCDMQGFISFSGPWFLIYKAKVLN